jgi:hypothetical protein
MRHPGAGAICAALVSAVFLGRLVTSASAQIPGATNEPPIGPNMPNHPVGMPFGLKVGLAFLALLALGTAFYFALRAWRSSSLFQRQYRFPVPKDVALRLGASRSGGRMATIDFASNVPAESSPTNQKPEETPPP